MTVFYKLIGDGFYEPIGDGFYEPIGLMKIVIQINERHMVRQILHKCSIVLIFIVYLTLPPNERWKSTVSMVCWSTIQRASMIVLLRLRMREMTMADWSANPSLPVKQWISSQNISIHIQFPLHFGDFHIKFGLKRWKCSYILMKLWSTAHASSHAWRHFKQWDLL